MPANDHPSPGAEQASGSSRTPRARVRMSSSQRRDQLIEVSKALFAANGYEGTTVEEIAAAARVSKPVVYEHFGGKEGLYAVVVDRESRRLVEQIRSSLTSTSSNRELIEHGAMALLNYIDTEPDGFRILARDSAVGSRGGTFASILGDIAVQVEALIGGPFAARGFNTEFSRVYAQALTGMVAMVGQSWLDARSPSKEEVAAHLVNLAWYGMRNLETEPRLVADLSPRQERPAPRHSADSPPRS